MRSPFLSPAIAATVSLPYPLTDKVDCSRTYTYASSTSTSTSLVSVFKIDTNHPTYFRRSFVSSLRESRVFRSTFSVCPTSRSRLAARILDGSRIIDAPLLLPRNLDPETRIFAPPSGAYVPTESVRLTSHLWREGPLPALPGPSRSLSPFRHVSIHISSSVSFTGFLSAGSIYEPVVKT